jgi:CBS-domain-containing membrane protein
MHERKILAWTRERQNSDQTAVFPDLIELDQRAMMQGNPNSRKCERRPAMRAMDVMTTPVITVTPDTTVQELAKLLSEKGISGVPVVEGGDRLVGIVSEGDLLRRAELGTERRRSRWMELGFSNPGLAADYVKRRGSESATAR